MSNGLTTIAGQPTPRFGMVGASFPTQALANTVYTIDVAQESATGTFKDYGTVLSSQAPNHKLINISNYVSNENKAWLRYTFALVPGPVQTSSVLLPNGLVAPKTVQRVAAGTTADSGSLIEDSSVENESEFSAIKTTISTAVVFGQAVNTNTQAVTIPDRYLPSGVYRETVSSTVAGTDSTPHALGTGGTGVTEATAEMVRADRVRHTDKTLSGNPNSSLTDFERGPEGQSVTVTSTWSTDGTTPTISETTLSASVTNVGGGQFERIIKSATLFTAPEYSTERPDVVPVPFRALIPETTTSAISAGTAGMPSLGTGDIRASQQQVTLQTFRSTVTNRATTTTTYTDKEWTGEYGGAFLDVTKTLANGTPAAPSTDFKFVGFEAHQLGNGQTESTTRTNPNAWVLLSGSEKVTANRLLMRHVSATVKTVTRQTVDPGTTYAVDWHTIEATLTPSDALHSTLSISTVTAFDVLTSHARDPKYNGAATTTTETIVVAGTAATALGSGVVESSSEAIDSLRNLLRVTTLDSPGSIPPLLGSKFVPELNAIATVTDSKGTGLTVDGTALTLSSEVSTDAAGIQHKHTVALTATPPLQTDAETDPLTGQRIVTTHQHQLDPGQALAGVSTAAPSGVLYKCTAHGSSATLSTTVIPLPATWYYQAVVHVAIPRVLVSFFPFQINDPTTNKLLNTIVPTVYSSAGSQKVDCEVEVLYVPNYAALKSLKLTVQCKFFEQEWSFPGFSGRGLNDGQDYIYGDSQLPAREYKLPVSSPTATAWKALLGKQIIVNYEVRPYKAGYLEVHIFRGTLSLI